LLKNLIYVVGLTLSLAVASGRAEVPPQPSTAPAEPDKLTGGDDLGKHQAALAQIRESLARHNLTAAELQALREQIDPLSDSTSATLKRLESHLAAIKERLDQLGPKPDAKAPPERLKVVCENAVREADD
jgi:potassium-dependent mechanosensitive channel